MQHDFQGRRVLIAEDDYFLAQDLSAQFEAANAVVVGPYADLAAAQACVRHSQIAVLDIDLRGQRSFVLADRLMEMDIPFIFFTAFDKFMIPPRFAGIDCVTKPQLPSVALQTLFHEVARSESPSVAELIPILRLTARDLVGDHAIADRLIEVTLQAAISQTGALPTGAALESWLVGLMRRLLAEDGNRLMN